ncbi:hypothetical protein POTOM_015826 [Populus tomentosa]|uniref:TF-B3 domain-containing protein n=1 Tax=Populus tomentosa TaxID=118781 RepID=A0A8X8A0L8_POPTO|nr:hypothetical protein POTOM_015826 [Populus tomentosa]
MAPRLLVCGAGFCFCLVACLSAGAQAVLFNYNCRLPRKFCHLHLPNHDAIIILVDETEKEYQVVYIAERSGLRGGWRGFSIEHRLLEQDALVFQLIEPDKLKVYIVRANRLSETDGALGLMHLSHAKRTDFGKQRASRSARMLPLSLKNACKNRYSLVFRLSSVLSSESFKQFKGQIDGSFAVVFSNLIYHRCFS